MGLEDSQMWLLYMDHKRLEFHFGGTNMLTLSTNPMEGGGFLDCEELLLVL